MGNGNGFGSEADEAGVTGTLGEAVPPEESEARIAGVTDGSNGAGRANVPESGAGSGKGAGPSPGLPALTEFLAIAKVRAESAAEGGRGVAASFSLLPEPGADAFGAVAGLLLASFAALSAGPSNDPNIFPKLGLDALAGSGTGSGSGCGAPSFGRVDFLEARRLPTSLAATFAVEGLLEFEVEEESWEAEEDKAGEVPAEPAAVVVAGREIEGTSSVIPT